MRPPLGAGENEILRQPANPAVTASMRPPLGAGENIDKGE